MARASRSRPIRTLRRRADAAVLNLGASEMLVVLLVALFAFGPDKLPEAARRGGQVMTDIRSWSSTARRELSKALEAPEDDGSVRSGP